MSAKKYGWSAPCQLIMWLGRVPLSSACDRERSSFVAHAGIVTIWLRWSWADRQKVHDYKSINICTSWDVHVTGNQLLSFGMKNVLYLRVAVAVEIVHFEPNLGPCWFIAQFLSNIRCTMYPGELLKSNTTMKLETTFLKFFFQK